MIGVIGLDAASGSAETGGKAAALARLIKGGFNIPAGFVVMKPDNNAILQQFDQLDSAKVAIRSSAAAEDGAKDAWAGQLDTYLNVSRDHLLEKIQECFESANSDRAQAYAKQKGIQAGKVAVIIQKMVPADVSGVAFSAHPVTNDRSQLVIEAVSGLGEKLVSGTATPNTYLVNKDNKNIVEKYLAGDPDLSEQQINEVAEAVIKIEKLFGFPVDVEWAISGQELFILQSRPITTME